MNSKKQHKTMSCIAKKVVFKYAYFLILCFFATGCATGPTQYESLAITPENRQLVAAQPDVLRTKFERLYQEGQRNQVLNHMEIGLEAYRAGYFKIAKNSFDAAIKDIGAIYADNKSAFKARSLWHEEGAKNFKGEPYERSMVYFYRGMLYLRDADYENARASFINGIMQDAFAEEGQNRSDFALFLYLAGWSALQMGSIELAHSHFEELKLFRPDLVQPSDTHNILVVVETGKSPRKLADGVGHYELVYRRGKSFKDKLVSLEYDSKLTQAYPIEDIYYQASTRGGREVDKIIQGKAQFKKKTESFGSAISDATNNSVIAGYASLYGSSGSDTFSALSAISVASMALSARSKPRADTRYWKSLPDSVHVHTMTQSEGKNHINTLFFDVNRVDLPNLNRTIEIQYDANGIGLAHTNSR